MFVFILAFCTSYTHVRYIKCLQRAREGNLLRVLTDEALNDNLSVLLLAAHF